MIRTSIAIALALLVPLVPAAAHAQGQPQPAYPPAAPISISGTDVTPPPDLLPAPRADAPGAPGSASRERELEMRVAIDEARITKLERDVSPFRNLSVFGYVQVQYRVQSNNAAASANLQPNGSLPSGISSNDVIANPDGTTTNTNAFRLRRTRLGTKYETDVVRVLLQVDLLPSGGPVSTQNTIARNAEATGIAHWSKDVRTELTAGLMAVPFRLELEELSMTRPFIERSWASLNLFPTERDLGVHAKTFAMHDRLVIDAGILNGQRLGEPKIVLVPDLNASKDYFASVALKQLGPAEIYLSGYYGRGQVVDTTLLRVKNYPRYAGNLGARAAYTFFPKLGESRVVGEILLGKNMDTGVVYPFAVPAIPPAFNDDVTGFGERAIYLRAEQELTRWGIAGFRFDTYTPNEAIATNARDTYTFMLGARLSEHLRLINELAYAIDNIHPLGADPPSKHILEYSAWAQGTF